jgi:hypothetical protein
MRESAPWHRFLAALALACLGLAASGAENAPLKLSRERLKDGRDGPILLENAVFNIRIDPDQGGAATLIVRPEPHPDRQTHWQADRVAFGRLFTDTVSVGGQDHDLAATAYEVKDLRCSAEEAVVALSAAADKAMPSLRVDKTFTLRPGEAGFRLHVVFRNTGAGQVKARFGCRYSADPERWAAHTHQRLFAGGDRRQADLTAHYKSADFPTRTVTVTEGTSWFCGMNTYGKSVAAQLVEWPLPVEIAMTAAHTPITPEIRMVSAIARAMTPETTLTPGQSLALRLRVAVGDSLTGLETVTPDAVLVGADAPEFRPPNTPFSVYAAAVSPEPRQIEVVFSRRGGGNGHAEGIGRGPLTLAPGINRFARVETTMAEPGAWTVRAEFREYGRAFAAAERRVLIADPAKLPAEAADLAKRWDLKMPELRVAGAWSDIGREIARGGRHGFSPKALDAAKAKWAAAAPEVKERVARAVAFYQAVLPWYLEYLQGAGQGMDAPWEALLLAGLPDPKPAPAKAGCLDIAFLGGPDGPMAAWSNEDHTLPEKRCYYLHARPAQGYAFHAMDGYGVNEKGLAIGGADVGDHTMDRQKGQKLADDWAAAGNFFVPLNSAARGNVVWLLARCATVAEAVAFLTHPTARVSFTGNMVLVDAQGEAAVFQSTGLLSVVRRPEPGVPLTCTNYPGMKTADSFHYTGSAGLYFNGVLREGTVRRFFESCGGRLSLADAFALLSCRQEPGAICQDPPNNSASFITTTSFLAHSRTADLYLCWGNPWHTRFVRYSLTGP